MSKVIRVAPKRPIERIFSRVVDTSISASAESVTLYTAEENVTLIRILIEYIMDPVDNALAAPVRGECLLHVKPRGQQVADSPATSQSLDNGVSIEEIARFPWSVMWNDTNGIFKAFHGKSDIKAMRKLREGDEITLAYIAATASDVKFVANVYLWFKG